MSDDPKKQAEVSPALMRTATATVYTLLGATIVSILLGVYALADLVF